MDVAGAASAAAGAAGGASRVDIDRVVRLMLGFGLVPVVEVKAAANVAADPSRSRPMASHCKREGEGEGGLGFVGFWRSQLLLPVA